MRLVGKERLASQIVRKGSQADALILCHQTYKEIAANRTNKCGSHLYAVFIPFLSALFVARLQFSWGSQNTPVLTSMATEVLTLHLADRHCETMHPTILPSSSCCQRTSWRDPKIT